MLFGLAGSALALLNLEARLDVSHGVNRQRVGEGTASRRKAALAPGRPSTASRRTARQAGGGPWRYENESGGGGVPGSLLRPVVAAPSLRAAECTSAAASSSRVHNRSPLGARNQ